MFVKEVSYMRLFKYHSGNVISVMDFLPFLSSESRVLVRILSPYVRKGVFNTSMLNVTFDSSSNAKEKT